MGLKDVFKGKEKLADNKDLVRRLGAESMVLLKNDGVLPIEVGKIALFGAGAIDTIFCGNYSNYVYNPNKINVRDGLAAGGFTFSSEVWLQKMKKAMQKSLKDTSEIDAKLRNIAGVRKYPDEVPISEADLAEARVGTDICVYVVRRGTVDYRDRDYKGGDFLLSETEQDNIKKIAGAFTRVIVVLNSEILELGAVGRAKSIRGILLMGIPGMEAGNSLFDVLTGRVNPSGHLTDTWARKYKDNPACSNFSKRNRNNLDLDYKEGIYIGYRYFDSFDVTPLYPFGYGLSYTKFSYELTYFEANWFQIILKVKVKNIGNCPGKAVPQVYVSAPKGTLDKPYQELKGFIKTDVINPKECFECKIVINTKDLASFSEKKSAWIMDRGEYIFRLGSNSRDTEPVSKLVLNKQAIIKNVANVIEPDHEIEFMPVPEKLPEDTKKIPSYALNTDDLRVHNKPVKKLNHTTTYVHEGSNYSSYVNENKFDIPFRCKEEIQYVRPISSHSFIDVAIGNVTLEDFVASLSPEILARLCCGAYEESIKETDNRLSIKISQRKKVDFAGKTTNQYAKTLGIPGVTFIDGPLGLHIPETVATCFPCPTSMAQTWDVYALEEMGRALGKEMEHYGIDYVLAPAINIHRDPMAGRGYEYYSEDPLISGTMGAYLAKGIQSVEGRGAIVKHFCLYNMDRGVEEININISRRALREIYIKGFLICVTVGKPCGVMNSRNKINGIHASSQRPLNLDILRGEMEFEGFVISEWGTSSKKAYDIHSGCDLIMPGFNPDKLLHAMMHILPSFNEDGYVDEVQRTTPFGKKLITYDSWGSFLPDADGPDCATANVSADKELNPRVEEFVADKKATVTVLEDGSKTVTYKGYDRGAFLALGDLQLSAMHILRAILKSGSMNELLNQAKK